MGLLQFDKLPINPLVGADRKTFDAITRGHAIDKPYLGKYRLTRMIGALLATLKPIQDRRYRNRLEQQELEFPPVFILGHWRSGTTFVHNVLAKDSHFGYNTTYQTVFPHLMMWGQPLFKPMMKWLMPDKRPTDNMELSPELPQEEEFALSNMMPYTYYNFWYLPRAMREYCDKYLLFDQITEEEKQVFKETFIKLIKISLWNTGGTQFLSKNPPHTGRVSALLEMFPDAKFIYLMRNPYTVFESTRSFFNNTIRPLKLQEADPAYLEENILEVYTKLYRKYEAEKSLIPHRNLYEIRFEDFEADPYERTGEIYRKLDLPGFESAQDRIKEYLEKKKGYTKNKYVYEQRTLDLVRENWGYAFKDWGYEL
ncbi:MAG: sulfotransferase [Alistipes sp.]|nr:sulfotransferase [Alistipes sp.]